MKKEYLTGLCSGLLIITVCSVVALANPGSDENPLISKNYLENVFMNSVKQYINEKTSFKVVSLTNGQQLIGEAGCELILRQGSATVVATAKGGLADTTLGGDIADGLAMPSNHLLIIPVSDGRGITAKNDVLVMVKGDYTIK